MWFTRISLKNPVFATMVMLAIVVLGLFSYQRLKVDQFPNIDFPVVVVTAFASIETAVAAIKQGAYDYLPKTFSVDQLTLVVERALRARSLSVENRNLRGQLQEMREVRDRRATLAADRVRDHGCPARRLHDFARDGGVGLRLGRWRSRAAMGGRMRRDQGRVHEQGVLRVEINERVKTGLGLSEAPDAGLHRRTHGGMMLRPGQVLFARFRIVQRIVTRGAHPLGRFGSVARTC